MTLSLGMKAQIRSMVFIAGEPIPLFWPMRSFIHHNPLHGLEKFSFEQAVVEGERLLHGRGFLPRSQYQEYRQQGKVDELALQQGIARFLENRPQIDGLDLSTALYRWMTQAGSPLPLPGQRAALSFVTSADVAALIRQQDLPPAQVDAAKLADTMFQAMMENCPMYRALDTLFDAGIADELDELVIKSCLDFFDEGQSVWGMPDRERGFFAAWRELARHNIRFLGNRDIRDILDVAQDPESIIVHVMESLGIPENRWGSCFRGELACLHGWTGFIRWRANARHYHASRRFPGDLVDFLAIRLTLALALIRQRSRHGMPGDARELEAFIRERPTETLLRQQLYSGQILPVWAQRAEAALLAGKTADIESLGQDYLQDKRRQQAQQLADWLHHVMALSSDAEALSSLPQESIAQLLDTLQAFEQHEGMIWLQAMELRAIERLLPGLVRQQEGESDKRPFVQALFCIDTRSERLRRHLESVGDFQTFGIAGFFGVPVSFMELGKGTEAHLCPVLLTPKNLVMEMSVSDIQDTVAFTVLEKAVHDLKESVLTPFVTVEAIGLLFGFDMLGKTLAPVTYNRWREGLHDHKPHTHLLIDKLGREQADSIVRAVQRAVIARAIEQEFGVPPERIRDDLVRQLREVALGNSEQLPALQEAVSDLDPTGVAEFVARLQTVYRINRADARMQMERLGRIGFSLDEQVTFVSQALHAIGLVENFSRFVLVVGHGSQSQNNPYESALDCGACGGNIGVYNARIFAAMANKPVVRRRLRQLGLVIPDDTWFVPAMHNTTTDEITLYDLDLLPSTHPIYLDRLRNGLAAACRLCTRERVPELDFIDAAGQGLDHADKLALRNAMDWSQVRPEWGLSRNAYFIIGRRTLTRELALEGRAFLHSYDYHVDSKLLLLENILTGPLVVGQWINMEHYFSAVDNEHYGSGSKVYHNVAGRFGVMTGNLSDLRTGLPAQTVLANGRPYHEPMRLITVIEAPFAHVVQAIDRVSSVRQLMNNGWIRMLIVDPESGKNHIYDYERGQWQNHVMVENAGQATIQEANVS